MFSPAYVPAMSTKHAAREGNIDLSAQEKKLLVANIKQRIAELDDQIAGAPEA